MSDTQTERISDEEFERIRTLLEELSIQTTNPTPTETQPNPTDPVFPPPNPDGSGLSEYIRNNNGINYSTLIANAQDYVATSNNEPFNRLTVEDIENFAATREDTEWRQLMYGTSETVVGETTEPLEEPIDEKPKLSEKIQEVLKLPIEELLENDEVNLNELPNESIAILIYKFLEYIYGEEFVDWAKTTSNENPFIFGVNRERNILGDYSYIVHFPKLTVRSESGKTHDITDFYITFTYSTSTNSITRLQGVRKSGTIAEVDSHYSFSHISSRPGQVGAFCVGNGTLGNKFKVAETYMGAYTLSGLFDLLFSIHPISSYESISGTPYRRIEAIMRKDNSAITSGTYRGYVPLAENIMTNIYDKLLPILEKNTSQSRSGELTIKYYSVLMQVGELIKSDIEVLRWIAVSNGDASDHFSEQYYSFENPTREEIEELLFEHGTLQRYNFVGLSLPSRRNVVNSEIENSVRRTENALTFKGETKKFVLIKNGIEEEPEVGDVSLNFVIMDIIIKKHLSNIITNKVNEYKSKNYFGRRL